MRKEKKKKKNKPSMKIYMVSLLHRATIKIETTGEKYNGLPYYI